MKKVGKKKDETRVKEARLIGQRPKVAYVCHVPALRKWRVSMCPPHAFATSCRNSTRLKGRGSRDGVPGGPSTPARWGAWGTIDASEPRARGGEGEGLRSILNTNTKSKYQRSKYLRSKKKPLHALRPEASAD